MRGYSRFRVVLLGALLATAVLLAADGWAQTTAPASSAAEARKQGLMDLILSHPDPVFFTIAILSITGLALIIEGFIETRESVFMQPASTNVLGDVISE